ncbi:polysaccharide biosynthesis/export family protein [Aquamicrobium sp. LC103]|uniref:polysaccharide biosynthesis/export family protein n=1 Tax=Aquamicrobium sp. LC103 TaxID=1120658 RepID=UPI00063EA651|nr:polysaccharide biosynthesis/export family protein [Aquamicrobium sp. LC103]TKT80252.1 exopolysaccharide biosynthesis protein [Aquamicrobium sp. LC103]
MVMSHRLVATLLRGPAFAALAAVLAASASSTAFAEGGKLYPQTKLRLTVVQWMPTRGEYQQWPALGGEYVVSAAGTVMLPVLGAVPVGDLDSQSLATDIANRLQEKIGLVTRPETTVEVVQYPPIYVVGDVAKPGEYAYRTDLTVLQALALGGGELRDADATRSQQEIRLVGELRSLDDGILRSMSRIARLEAEMAGAGKIEFPPVPAGNANSRLATEIFEQEKIIFSARRNALDRQEKSLSELRDLLTAEIKVLEQKIEATEEGIRTTEQELSGVKVLVDKGIAVVSRRTDLERVLAGYRSDRLDHMTAVMRARQGMTETTRNLEGLADQHQTEVAAELQREQANLDEARLKKEISQKLLMETLSSAPAAAGDAKTLTYTITRQEAGRPKQFEAEEDTPLLPGDVVKAAFVRDAGAAPDAAAAAASPKATQ